MHTDSNRFDLVGRRPIWYGISAATIVLGLVFMGINYAQLGAPLNLGVDFTGGSLMQFQFPKDITPSDHIKVIEKTRRHLISFPWGEGAFVAIEGRRILTIKMSLSPERADLATIRQGIEKYLAASFAGKYGQPQLVALDSVGPIVGRELKTKALLALLFGNLLIIIYLGIRYDFAFGVCAVIALAHDCLIMIGALAATRMVVNSEFVAALLTVVGFSVNDTVVIFDRIRENLGLRRSEPFDKVVNDSLLQTMTRSINTVLTVLTVLLCIFLMGGPALRSFSFALLVGIASGAYSSIFNASQLLVSWRNWQSRRRVQLPPSKRAVRRVVTPPKTPAPVGDLKLPEEEETSVAASSHPSGSRQTTTNIPSTRQIRPKSKRARHGRGRKI